MLCGELIPISYSMKQHCACSCFAQKVKQNDIVTLSLSNVLPFIGSCHTPRKQFAHLFNY